MIPLSKSDQKSVHKIFGCLVQFYGDPGGFRCLLFALQVLVHFVNSQIIVPFLLV